MTEQKRYSAKGAAEYVGIGASTWRSYVARKRAPGPDGKDGTYGKDYWLQSTLDEFKASRPGRGWHGPRKSES